MKAIAVRATVEKKVSALPPDFSIARPGLSDALYIERRALFEGILLFAPKISGIVLDIGCGRKPYKSLFFNSDKYFGLDHIRSKGNTGNKADFYYKGRKFPFKSGSFDAAVCTQVIEHVEDPFLLLHETRRVLKKGGLLLLTCPFVWSEHEEPYDFTRFSSFGIKKALAKEGFEIVAYRKSTSGLLTLLQMFNLSISNAGFRNVFARAFAKGLIVTANILAFSLWHGSGAGKFYLNNIILVKKK